jgi:hypothetical protein
VPAVALLLAGTGLFRATAHVPEFYREALVAAPPPAVRKDESRELERQARELVAAVDRSDEWSARFLQSRINSWLAEDFAAEYGAHLPHGMRDPRVAFEEGRISCGVRLERPGWGGIASVILRPRVLGPNRLAVEVESIRAGLLPVPIESLREEVLALCGNRGLPARWELHDGHDVLVLDLDPTGAADAVLESVDVRRGVVTIAGRSRKPEETGDGRESESQNAIDAERNGDEVRAVGAGR